MAAAEEEQPSYPSARYMCEFAAENSVILNRSLQNKILGLILKASPSSVHDNRSGADIDLDSLDIESLKMVYDIVKKRREALSTKLIS